MAKSKRQTKKDKKEMIIALKKELKANDDLFKKNTEKYDEQVQIALYGRGYPQNSPMYDHMISNMKLDIEEISIAIEGGFKVLHPMFDFHTNPRWQEIQGIKKARDLEALKHNLKEIENNVDEVKNDIVAQNGRMKERRIQILEDLEALGEDVKKLKEASPDYIG